MKSAKGGWFASWSQQSFARSFARARCEAAIALADQSLYAPADGDGANRQPEQEIGRNRHGLVRFGTSPLITETDDPERGIGELPLHSR